jgi:hypothetical protein
MVRKRWRRSAIDSYVDAGTRAFGRSETAVCRSGDRREFRRWIRPLLLFGGFADGRIESADPWSSSERQEIEALQQEAEAAFRENLSLQPEEPGSLFGLGWIHFVRRDFNLAIEQYSNVAAITHGGAGERKKYLADALKNSACCRLFANESADSVFNDLRRSKSVAAEEGLLAKWLKEVTKTQTSRGSSATIRRMRPV